VCYVSTLEGQITPIFPREVTVSSVRLGERWKWSSLRNRKRPFLGGFLVAFLVISLGCGLRTWGVVSSNGAAYSAASQALLQDGFESGNFQAWSGTAKTSNENASVSSATPYDGRFGASFATAPVLPGVRLAYCYENVPAAISAIYARGYFLISQGLPLNDNDDRFGLISFEVGGQLQCTFRVLHSGGGDRFNVVGFNGSSAFVSIGTNAIYPVQGHWFEVEFYIRVSAVAGEYRAWINGVQQIVITGVNTAGFDSEVSKVRFGLTSTINVQHVVQVQFDSAVISTAYIGQLDISQLFQDGFESGGFQAWDGTVTTTNDIASVSSAAPYDGSFGANFATSPVVSGTRLAYCYEDVSPQLSEIHARGYFLISQGLPLNDTGDRFGLIAFEVGGQLQCTLRVYRSGGLDRFNIIGLTGTASVSASTDNIYPIQGRWYEIEFYVRVDGSNGEYAAWINGVEQIDITGLNTSCFADGVSRVRFGLTSTINVQHPVQVHLDSAAISTAYIGQLRYTFGIVGSLSETPALNNFVFLFGNQSISYRVISPFDVTGFEDVDRFDGLVVCSEQRAAYNSSAIKQFASLHPVISDMRDLCQTLYPSLSASMQVVSASTVTYAVDWGNFHAGDTVDIRNETGNSNQLNAVLATALSPFSNVTTVSRYDTNRVAMLRMNGTQQNSGFFVMDLDATTPESDWNGIWHVFPAVKMVQDFPTGEYAEWMANGQNMWNLTWVYNRIDALLTQNNDIAKKRVIGKSGQGRNITAIFIGTGTKNVIIDGAIHGNEKTGTFACLRTAELLIDHYRTGPSWKAALSEFTVIIVPVLNPDGFAADSRYNANGVDLNEQFPPDGAPTQPEAFALMNLMGNYTPSVYVNMHEGYYWYPLDMLYGNYETGAGKAQTISDMTFANESFTGLQHWGWFTDAGEHVWVGTVNAIYQGGKLGMAVSYASYEYHASCMLIETFVWSDAYGARQSLWALDYYPAVTIAFLQQHFGVDDGVFEDGFESGSFGSWSGVALTPGDNASVVQTNPYEGAYSATFQTGAISSGTRQACVYENVAANTIYARGYFYIANGLPLEDNGDRFAFMAFGAGGTTLASFRVFRSGGVDRFNIIGYSGTNCFPTNSTDAVYPAMGRWYCIEFYAKIDGTAGEYRASVDGVELLSITNVNTAILGNINKVYWGIASSINVQHTVQVYADNAQIG